MKKFILETKKALAHVTRAICKFNDLTEKYWAIYIARAAIRAAVLYSVFLFSYRLVCGNIPDYDDYYMNSGRYIAGFRALFVFLIYFTVTRTFRVFDTRARRHNGDKRQIFSIEFVSNPSFTINCNPTNYRVLNARRKTTEVPQ